MSGRIGPLRCTDSSHGVNNEQTACVAMGTGRYVDTDGNLQNCWAGDSDSDSATELTNRGGASGWATSQADVESAATCKLKGCTASIIKCSTAKKQGVCFYPPSLW